VVTFCFNLRHGHAAILSLESTGEGRREEQKKITLLSFLPFLLFLLRQVTQCDSELR